jgi:hypothetical protein
MLIVKFKTIFQQIGRGDPCGRPVFKWRIYYENHVGAGLGWPFELQVCKVECL